MNADISYIMSCSDDEFERVTGVRLPEDAWDRWSDDMDKRKNQLLALFEKSVAAEREACAKVCEKAIASIWEYSPEDVKQTGTNVCNNLATAIRARSNT